MVKNICKRSLSTLLALIMIITTFCFADLGLFASASTVRVVEQNDNAAQYNFIFNVPESIYLKPGSSKFQYFLTSHFVDGEVSAPSQASEAFSLELSCSQASKVKVSYEIDTSLTKTITSEDGTTSATGTVSIATSGSELTASTTSKTVNGTSVTIPLTNGVLNGWTAAMDGTEYFIKWTAEWTIKGTVHKAYAYTSVYIPYLGSAGNSLRTGYTPDDGSEPRNSAYSFMTGGHTVSGGNYYSTFTGTTPATVLAAPLVDFSKSTIPNGLEYFDTGTVASRTGGGVFAYQTTRNGDGNPDPEDNGGAGEHDAYAYFGTAYAGDASIGIPTMSMTIDTSRFTNYSQVPNLRVGLAMYRCHYVGSEDESELRWIAGWDGYINDAGTAATVGASNTTILTGSDTKNAGPRNHSITVSVSSSDFSADDSSVRGLYSLNGTVSGGNHLIMTAYNNAYYDLFGHRTNATITGMNLKVNAVNKADLRRLVYQAYSKGYSDQMSSSYITSLKNAAAILADQYATADQISTAYNEINTATNNNVSAMNNYIDTTFVSDNTCYFYVPEAIYLAPSTGTMTTFQYYVNNTFNNTTKGITLDKEAEATSGKIYFSCAEATAVTIKVDATTATNGSKNFVSGVTYSGSSLSNGYCSDTITAGTKTGITENSGTTLTWTATYTTPSGTKTATAYTYVYAPLCNASSTAASMAQNYSTYNAHSNIWYTTTYWLTGGHSVSCEHGAAAQSDSATINYKGQASFYYGSPLVSSTVYGPSASAGSPTAGSGMYYGGLGTADGGDENWLTVNGGTLHLTVDNSRYDNYSQIPNLTIGFDQNGRDSDSAAEKWTNGGIDDSIQTGVSTTVTAYTGNANRRYHVTHFSGALTSGELALSARRGSETKKKSGCITNTHHFINRHNIYLDTTLVSKATLRSTLNAAIQAARQSELYTSASWSTYSNAMKSAGAVLGNPKSTASEISSANTTLAEAVLVKKTANANAYDYSLIPSGSGYTLKTTIYTNGSDSTITNTHTYSLGDNVYFNAASYTGYTYKGYSTSGSETGLTNLTPEDSITFIGCTQTSDINRYFYYVPNAVEVTFDPVGGAVSPTTKTVYYGQTYGTLPTPTRLGCTFQGWYTDTNYTTPVTSTTRVTTLEGTQTLYAKWEMHDYTLTVNANAGKNTANLLYIKHGAEEATSGSSASITATATKYGDGADLTGTFMTNTTGSGNNERTTYTPLRAYLEAGKSYTLTYDSSGNSQTGTYSNGTSKTYITEMFVMLNGTTTGGNYTGLGTSSTGGTYTKTFTVPATGVYWLRVDQNCLAQEATSTQQSYWVNNIRITEDSYTTDADNQYVQYSGSTLVLPNPVREGWTFKGWTPTSLNGTLTQTTDEGGTAYNIYTFGGANDAITATWEENTYTITYEVNGGTLSSTGTTQNYKKADAFDLKTASKTGYTFSGWTPSRTNVNDGKDYNWGTSDITSYRIAAGTKYGNVTLTAKYTAKTFTLKYNAGADDSSISGIPGTQTLTYNTATQMSNAEPTRTGYTFKGWSSTNGATAIDYAKTGNIPAATVNGWFTACSGGTYNVYAVWQAIGYTVTFDANTNKGSFVAGNGFTAGNSNQTKTVNYGSTYGASNGGKTWPAATKSGYDFDGWYTAATGGTKINSGDTFSRTSGITLYAQFTLKSFEVRYNAGTTASVTELPGNTSFTYDTAGTLSGATPVRTGYTFLGWAETSGATAARSNSVTASEVNTWYTAAQNNNGIYDVYAVWQAKTFTLAYDKNAGSETVGSMPANAALTYDSGVTLSANTPTRNGYTFKGWAESSTATAATYQKSASINASTVNTWFGTVGEGGTKTLYAVWQAKTFTLAYNKNTTDTTVANMPGNATLTYGTAATVSATVPTRTGYAFSGWSTSSGDSATVNYASGATIAASTVNTWFGTVGEGGTKTLYAVWTARTFKLAYDKNAGAETVTNMPATETVPYGADKVLPANEPVRTGYTFKGWATSNSATTAEYAKSGTVPAATVNAWYTAVGENNTKTIYAVWEAKTFSLLYNENAGDATVTNMPTGDVLTYNQSGTVSATEPSRTGYDFKGWATTASATTAAYGASATILVATVNSWYSAAVNNAYTLYAVWQKKSFTLAYNKNTTDTSVTGMPGNATLYYDTAATLSASEPTRTGYTFKGWATSSTATTAAYQKSASIAAGTVNTWYGVATEDGNDNTFTLYAVWGANAYKVSFVLDDAGAEWKGWSGSDTVTDTEHAKSVVYATAYGTKDTQNKTWPKDPELTGYHFTGWFESTTSTTPITSTTTFQSSSDVTLHARFAVNQYTVKYVLNNGQTNPADTTATYDVAFGVNKPSYSGYDFDGWTITGASTGDLSTTDARYGTSASSVSTAFSGFDKVCKDSSTTYFKNLSMKNGAVITFTANWSLSQYTVTINPNGGTISATYYQDRNASNAMQPGSSKTTDGIGTNGTTITALYNTNVALTAADRVGYAFNGWKIGASSTAASGSNVTTYTYGPVTGDVTLSADWVPKTATLQFNVGTGTFVNGNGFTKPASGMPSKTITYDAIYGITDNGKTWPADPTRTGYTFSGWYTSNAGGSKVESTDTFSPATFTDGMTVTLYARYTANKYKITYKPGTGTGTDYSTGIDYTYGGSVTFYTNNDAAASNTGTVTAFKKTGYTFQGWATTSGAAAVEYEAGSELRPAYLCDDVDGEAVLYAVWAANTYTVNYAGMDNAAFGTDHPTSAAYDAVFDVSAPSKTGYTFTGWKVTSGLDTATAKWGTTNAPATAVSASTACVNGTNPVYFKNLTSAKNGSVTLTANWQINSYGLNVYAYGNSASAVGTYANSTPGGKVSITAETTDAKTVAVTSGNNSAHAVGTVTYYQKATITAAANEGYAFIGWTTSAEDAASVTDDTLLTRSASIQTTEMGTNGLTYYAVFAVQPYTLNVSVASGSAGRGTVTPSGETTYNYKAPVTVTATPTANTGYEFAGWTETTATGVVTNDNKDNARLTFDMPAGNVTLEAAFSAKKFFIAFDGNAPSTAIKAIQYFPETATAYYDEDCTYSDKVSVPALEGHTFLGWSTSQRGTAAYDTDKDRVLTAAEVSALYNNNVIAATNTVTLYAVWAVNKGTLNVYAYCNSANALNTYNRSDVGGFVTINVAPCDDLTDNNSAWAKYNMLYNTATTLVATAKTGYTFLGWMPEGTVPTAANVSSATITTPKPTDTIVEQLNYYAVFSVNQYTLTVDYATDDDRTVRGDGLTRDPADGVIYYGGTATVTATPKKGYHFKEWIETTTAGYASIPADNFIDSSLQSATATFKMPNGNVTLKASFEPDTFTINFMPNKPSGSGTVNNMPNNGVTATYASALTYSDKTSVPTLTGYTFNGWATAANGTAAYDTDTNKVFTTTDIENLYDAGGKNGSITLYAVWTINSYGLDVYAYGNAASDVNAFANGTTGGTVSITAVTDKVSVTSGNGSAHAAGTVVFGQKASITATPATGYKLKGWTTSATDAAAGTVNADLTSAPTIETSVMPETGLKYYAVFEVETYTLTVNVNGNGTVTPADAASGKGVYYGATVSGIQPAANTGYHFTGWTATGAPSTFSTSSGAAQTITMPANNVTLTANFAADTFKIDFEENVPAGVTVTGMPTDGQTATYNTALTYSANKPAREGYTFKGWAATASGAAAYDTDTNRVFTNTDINGIYGVSTVVNNERKATLYAVWEINTYTITIDTEGNMAGETPEASIASVQYYGNKQDPTAQSTMTNAGNTFEVVALYGTDVTIDMPEKQYYRFKGWKVGSTVLDGSDSDDPFAYTVGAANVTLTAEWEYDAYNVTINPTSVPTNHAGAPTVSGTVSGVSYTNGQRVVSNAPGFSRSTTLAMINGTTATIQQPTLKGYDFTGWTANTTPEGAVLNSNTTGTSTYKVGEGDATLTAGWTEHTYQIIYYNEGSSAVNDSQHNGANDTKFNFYSDEVIVKSPGDPALNFSKTGYAFAGWEIAGSDLTAYPNNTIVSAGANLTNASSVDGATVELTATWSAEQYVIDYNLGYDANPAAVLVCVPPDGSNTVSWVSTSGNPVVFGDNHKITLASAYNGDAYYYLDTCAENTTHADGIDEDAEHCFALKWALTDNSGSQVTFDFGDEFELTAENIGRFANVITTDSNGVKHIPLTMVWSANYAEYERAFADFQNKHMVFDEEAEAIRGSFIAEQPEYAGLPAFVDLDYTDDGDEYAYALDIADRAAEEIPDAYPTYNGGVYGIFDEESGAVRYAWAIGDVNGTYVDGDNTITTAAGMAALAVNDFEADELAEYNQAYIDAASVLVINPAVVYRTADKSFIESDEDMDDAIEAVENLSAETELKLKPADLDKKLDKDELADIYDDETCVIREPIVYNAEFIEDHFGKTFDSYPVCSDTDDPDHSFKQLIEMCNGIFEAFGFNAETGTLPVFIDEETGEYVNPKDCIYTTESVEALFGLIYGSEDDLGSPDYYYWLVVNGGEDPLGKLDIDSLEDADIKIKRPTQFVLDEIVAYMAADYHVTLELKKPANFDALITLTNDYLAASWGEATGKDIRNDNLYDFFTTSSADAVTSFLTTILDEDNQPISGRIGGINYYYGDYTNCDQLYIDGAAASAASAESLVSYATNAEGNPYYSLTNAAGGDFYYENGTLCAQLIDLIDHLQPKTADYSSIFNKIYDDLPRNTVYPERAGSLSGDSYETWYTDYSQSPNPEDTRTVGGTDYYYDYQYLYSYYTKDSVDALFDYLTQTFEDVPDDNTTGIYWNYSYFDQDQINGANNSDSILNTLTAKIGALVPKEFWVVAYENTDASHQAVTLNAQNIEDAYAAFKGYEQNGESKKYYYGNTFIGTLAKPNTNWTLKEWNTSPAGTESSYSVNNSFVLNSFTFTGDVVGSVTADPAKPHRFQCTGKDTITYPPEEGKEVEVLVLYAIWATAQNSVTVKLNGGTVTSTTTKVDLSGTQTTATQTISSDTKFDGNLGDTLVLPEPTRTGYTFAGWTYTADEDVDPETRLATWIWNGTTGTFTFDSCTAEDTLEAAWTANDDTAYTVEHYVMGTDGQYPATATRTEDKTGTTDSTLTLSDLKISELEVENGIAYSFGQVGGVTVPETTVAPDGSRVIKLYYVRSRHALSLTAGTGISTVTGAGTYYYGQSVPINATVSTGYTWSKWSDNDTTQSRTFTMPAADTALTANATENTYTIIFNGNGATSGSTASMTGCKYTETYALRENGFVKEGHDFLGWAETQGATTAKYPAGETNYVTGLTAVNNGEVTLYAVWKINTYTITVNTDGHGTASSTPANAADYGTTVALSATPSTGYSFGEWTSAQATIDQATAASTTFTMPAANVVVTASFVPNEYTVTFNANGHGTPAPTSMTVTYDAAYGELAAISATGYTFGGWFKEAGCTTPVNAETTVKTAENHSLFAKWTAKTFKLAYNAGAEDSTIAGIPSATTTLTYDQTATLANVTPTRTGYTFKGWDATSGATEAAYTKGQSIDAATVDTWFDAVGEDGTYNLYAIWEINTYTITVLNDGHGTASSDPANEADFNTNVALTATPSEGYSFDHWETGDVTITNNAFLMPDKNVVITAIFAVNSYNLTVTNNDNHAQSFGSNPESGLVNYGKSVTLSQTPNEGYHFVGWASGDVSVESNRFSMPAKDVTVDAVYAPNTYTIDFNGNNATSGSAASIPNCAYDADITIPQTGYTRDGFNFVGWTVDAPIADLGASAQIPQAVIQSTEVKNLTATDGDTVTLYAVWQIVSYTVTYVANDETGSTRATINPNAQGYTVNDTVTTATAVREGYTFNGWLASGENNNWSGTYSAAQSVTGKYGNVTMTAQWTPITYRVTFNGNGETSGSMDAQTLTFDAESTPLRKNTYKKEGYTFKGWDTASAGTTVAYTDEQPVSNLCNTQGATLPLYAVWEVNNYKLKVTNDDTHAASVGAADLTKTEDYYTVPFGTTVTLTQTAKPGYTFSRWNSSDVVVANDNTFVMPVPQNGEYIVVDAIYTANTYTVTFHKNDENAGGTMGVETFTYDVSKALNENVFTLAQHTFAGWNTSADGTGTSYADKETVTNLATSGNVDLYAQWTLSEFALTFNVAANGGTFTAGQNFTAGTTEGQTKRIVYDDAYGAPDAAGKTWPSTPTKTAEVNGQTVNIGFVGWFTEATGGTQVLSTDIVKVTEDTILYAQFETISDLEELVNEAMSINANHYTIESLQALDDAIKQVMDEGKTDGKTKTALEDAIEGLVEIENDGGAPEFHVFENKEVVATELNAGTYGSTNKGEELAAINSAPENGDIGYVYPGKCFYTYHCYTNSANPVILVSTEDIMGTDNRVSYPTKFAGVGGVNTSVKTSTGTVGSGWMNYNVDSTEVGRRAAGYDAGSQTVDNAYEGLLTYAGSKCGDGSNYSYYKDAGYLVLRPTFNVETTRDSKQYALYTISAYDDSKVGMAADNSTLAGAKDFQTYESEGTDLKQTSNADVTPTHTITVYVEYHNSMMVDENSDAEYTTYRTDAGGQIADSTGTGTGTGTNDYLSVYNNFAEDCKTEENAVDARESKWNNVDYLYRNSGGFTSSEATTNFITPIYATEGTYAEYLGNDPQFQQNDVGSFYYLLAPDDTATDTYWTAYDGAISSGKTPAEARVIAANAATPVMNEKVSTDMKSGELKSSLNQQQQAIKSQCGEYISWPFTTSTRFFTQFYASAICREEALVYVHIYDRYGNEFTTILQRNFQDYLRPIISVTGVGTATLNETGWSGIKELKVTKYNHGGNADYVPALYGMTDEAGLTWSVSGNTYTVTGLGAGDHNYAYTLCVIDNAGLSHTRDIFASPDGNGSITITVNDVRMGGDYKTAAENPEPDANIEDGPTTAFAPMAIAEDGLTMMSIDNVEMAEIAADQIVSAVAPTEETVEELPDVYTFKMNDVYTVNLFVPGEEAHDIVLQSTEGGVIKAYINGEFAKPTAGVIHVPGQSDVQIRVATKSGYELQALRMVYPDGTTVDLTGAYNAEITSDVRIKAIFVKTDAKVIINVENGGINGKSYAVVSPYSMVTIAAFDAPAGKQFAYWANGGADGEPVSYDAIYTFAATSNATLTAVYSDAAVEKIAAVTMDEANAAHVTLVNGRYSLAYSGKIALPEGATIKEYGMVLTNQTADQCTAENLVIGGTINGVSNFKLVGEVLTEEGQFKMNVNNVAPGATRTGRMYLTVELADGTVQTVYSSTWSSLSTPAA